MPSSMSFTKLRSVQSFFRAARLLASLAVLCASFAAHGALVLVPAVPDGSTVWTGNVATELDDTGISTVVGRPGLASFYGAGFGYARLETSGDAAAQIAFTAKAQGLAGHGITVALLDPSAADSPLSVSVMGNVITISLATNESGALTSTAAQVVGAVNASPAASVLVHATTAGGGAGVVNVLGATPLAPVVVEAGPFAPSYQTLFSQTPSFPENALIAFGGGPAIASSSLFLYVRDSGDTPAFYIYDLLAHGWNGVDNLSLSGFWPGAGAIAQVKIVGIAATTVAEPTTVPLLVMGVLALVVAARTPERFR
jgi:hypothetical protein